MESYRENGTLFAMADGSAGAYDFIVWFDERGNVTNFFASQRDRPPERSAVRRETAFCGSNLAAYLGIVVPPGKTPWRTNAGTYPRYGGNTARGVLGALRNAHITWNRNTNYCGIPDRSRVAFVWRGNTSRGLNVGDKVNTTLWQGNPPGCSGTCLAATYGSGNSGGVQYEADIAFNAVRTWSTRPGCNATDIQSVATHELGHQLGLAHVGGSTNSSNVMFFAIPPCNLSGRRLGRGDANANNFLY